MRKVLAAALAAIAIGASAAEFELTGFLEAEVRAFANDSPFPGVRQHSASVAAEPQFFVESDDRTHSAVFTPFLRLDSADGRRSHFDVRELNYHYYGERFELRAGLGKVFWGVTESRHLVDIINQTDLVENVDGEDKLGQPMVQLTYKPEPATLELFVLPGFRERTFPGPRGRLRSEPYVDADAALYESGAERYHVDLAARVSGSVGVWDYGLAHFWGTSRTPRLLVDVAADGRPRLRPRYDIVHRSSLDLQATVGAMLWKLETVLESGQGPTHLAWVAGGEYTVFGIGGTRADLGLLLEHLMDGRGRNAPQPFANDLFLGARLALNDEASSELLAGVILDLAGDGALFSLEASRRLGERWTLDVEARVWAGVPADDLLSSRSEDDYLQLTLRRYF